MPFINEILKYRSLSIVGLEKNTGKTVCLNYVLRRLNEMGIHPAVTSIGVDGEQTDAVYGSAKPEVRLYDGSLFITSERHYRQKRLVSKLLEVTQQRTSLGRLVTAEVVCGGKVLLSGAASTLMLKRQLAHLQELGVPLTLVDGALSRLSLASPTVSEAMILATGAAVSANIPQLIQRTRFVYNLINLEETDKAQRDSLFSLENGLWAVDGDGLPHDLKLQSVLLMNQYEGDLFRYGTTFFAAGLVNDRLLRHLAQQNNAKHIVLITRDFTKIFVSHETLKGYLSSGARLQVLQRSNLVAITLNPTSPRGYNLHSEEACHALSDALGVPVYDVMKVER
ncbi:MAG: hypothetical protein SPJ13_06000 [Bacteroidales bacterium]|nr:hypothetical protein [Bacteroidales bacterium]